MFYSPTETTKSTKRCPSCKVSNYMIRHQWLDSYPEGNQWYDDHVCLKCGAYSDGSINLQTESLGQYRNKHSYLLAPEDFETIQEMQLTPLFEDFYNAIAAIMEHNNKIRNTTIYEDHKKSLLDQIARKLEKGYIDFTSFCQGVILMSKMMDKEAAETFLFKVDMDGLSYAVENYAPEDTGDDHFDQLVADFRKVLSDMDEYIYTLRDAYDIPVC